MVSSEYFSCLSILCTHPSIQTPGNPPSFCLSRGQPEWKPQLQETNKTNQMHHSLVSMKLWAMPCRAIQDGWVMVESSDKMLSTREGNGKPLQHSCLENTMNSKKGKNTGHWKMNSPGWQVPNMLLEISGQLNPERMKRGSLSKNSIQLWMWLVMEVVWCCKQQYCCKEPGMLGPWSRQIGSGQTGDGKSEHGHFRNWWTKMDCNGWI